MTAILNYFRESVEELHKVRWPTRQQAIRLSVIVLIFCAISSVIFGAIDGVFSELIRLFLTAIL